VTGADVVILATPIFTFEEIFRAITSSLPAGCIVTDVGSAKVLPHRWAAKHLPKSVHYVGSHPIAGSEQRGVEYARDDLFERAMCILTATKATNVDALGTLREFWSALGCLVKVMTPKQHDRILAKVSHLPHVAAAALINANKADELRFAGKGFMDTTRIASGPAGIWRDVLLANADNLDKGIDGLVSELLRIKVAIKEQDEKRIERLLQAARDKRDALLKHKLKKGELLS
jgi:prephenate dehydrogenase